MKKIFIILLLMSSFSGYSQTEKGDFVITPMVGWNTIKIDNTSEKDAFRVNFPVGFHKYLNDRLAVGLLFYFDYYSEKPNVTNLFQFNTTRIGILPEIRYNFLKTRLTPFIAGRISDIGYVTQFYDNPATPVELRRISQLNLQNGLQIDVGVSYFIRDRFGLQVKLIGFNAGVFDKINFKAFLPINFGLQFIINNPRQ